MRYFYAYSLSVKMKGSLYYSLKIGSKRLYKSVRPFSIQTMLISFHAFTSI